MGLNLTIDQGNSSVKIAIWDGTRLVGTDGATLVDRECLRELSRDRLAEVVDRFHPQAALVCSVTGNGPQISQWLRERGVEHASEVSYSMPLPIQIDYANPQTLGEDRIAAAVGAWALTRGRGCLVVDMGTAVTYDVVTADGRFAGGNIAPGVGMRLRSLNSFTARLPKVSGYGDTPVFGYDTVTAMRAGAIRGVAAEIAYYRTQLPPDTEVVLTGGWAERINRFLDFKTTVDSCLVTKGLLSIMLYNTEHHD